jgi:hypothetical protein
MRLELDRPRIPIRERTLLDILDLSLKVAILLVRPLVLATLATVLPMMVLNWWLVGWIASQWDESGDWLGYLWLMATLVFVEAPLASVPATMYLGKAMFYQPVRPREMLAELRARLPQLLWSHLVMRGIAAAWLLLALGRWQGDWGPAAGWLFLLACYVVVVRARRPFVNEIILLERAPWRSADKSAVTVRRRNAALHDPSSGDLFGRWLVSAGVAATMTVALALALWFGWWIVIFDQPWGPIMLHVLFPAAMWLVAGYFAVVRFLSYLDLRIRREGWEVELVVLAAAKQLDGSAVDTT